MEGLEFNASPGLQEGGRRLLFIITARTTQVGSCAVIVCLLLFFPKLSVPAALIVPVSPAHKVERSASTSASRLYGFLLPPVKEAHARLCVCECVCSRVLTGDLSHQSAAYIYPSLRPLSSQWRGAEGWGAQTGQHRSSLRREKLGMKLKLPSKARANAVT